MRIPWLVRLILNDLQNIHWLAIFKRKQILKITIYKELFVSGSRHRLNHFTRRQVVITVECTSWRHQCVDFQATIWTIHTVHLSLSLSLPSVDPVALRAEVHLRLFSTPSVLRWGGKLEHTNQIRCKHKQPAAKSRTKHMHTLQSALASAPSHYAQFQVIHLTSKVVWLAA